MAGPSLKIPNKGMMHSIAACVLDYWNLKIPWSLEFGLWSFQRDALVPQTRMKRAVGAEKRRASGEMAHRE